MLRILCKGRYLLKSVIHSGQRSPFFSSRGRAGLDIQTWGKVAAKILSFGAGGAALAGVVLAQAVHDDEEGAGTEGDRSNNNKPARDGNTWPDSKKINNKTDSKMFQAAITESRDLIQRIKDEAGCPGVVVGVSVDGDTVWTEGLGFADLENRVRIQPETVLRIASISKSITMAIVGKLWEAGKLDLDVPIQRYVPDFPEKTVDGEKVTITTRQLVSHLAGIRHYEKSPKKSKSDEKEDKKKENRSQDKDKEKGDTEKNTTQGDEQFKEFYMKKKFSSIKEALDLFKNDPLLHKPGSGFLYTTHGWTLVSAVAEGASKEKFTELLTGLFKDLGMTSTYLDVHDPLIYHRGRHYVKSKKGRIINAPYVDNSYKWAGGGLLSTVGDLLKFGNVMLYSFQRDNDTNKLPGETDLSDKSGTAEKNLTVNKNGQNERNSGNSKSRHGAGHGGGLPGYLKQDTVRQMWTVVDKTSCSWDKSGGYGMGWAVVPESVKHGCCEHQRYYVSHTGGAMGASSVLLVYPCAITSQMEDQGEDQGHQHADQGKESHRGEKLTVRKPLPETGQCQGHSKAQGRCGDNKGLPSGITVAIITNTNSVGLNKTAFQIAQIFEYAMQK